MSTSFVHVKGFNELQKFLDELPAKMEANIMRAAMRAGANVIREAAKANLASNNSIKTKSLYDNLSVSTRIMKTGQVVARVSAHSDPTNLAMWVEYGTAAHYIKVPDEARPTRKKRNGTVKMVSMKYMNKMVNRGSLVIGGNFVGASVHHPGAKPKPYMRPAFDNYADKALLAVGEAIKKRLNKQGLNSSAVDLAIEPNLGGDWW